MSSYTFCEMGPSFTWSRCINHVAFAVAWVVACMNDVGFSTGEVGKHIPLSQVATLYDQVERVVTETWWRHQMVTFSALLAFYAGNSSVNSPHKGQWRGALMFSLICAWINGWVNNREAGDLRRHRTHYDVPVMKMFHFSSYIDFCLTKRCIRFLHDKSN